VINVITKSGGNAFHGDGFVYFDSIDTAAQQVYKPGEDSVVSSTRVVDGNRFDYGADLGGFVLKDRLWFFAAYNRITFDRHISRAESSTYVSKDALFPYDEAGNLYSGKLTWNAAPSTTVVGTVFADPATTSGAAGVPPENPDPSTWYSSRVQGGTDYGLRLTQVFAPQFVATLQASSHRDEYSLVAADQIQYQDWRCSGGTPDQRCTLPAEPNAVSGGYGLGTGRGWGTRQQVSANLSFYAANHELKAGGDYRDGQSKARQTITGGQLVDIQNEYGQTYYKHIFFAAGPDDPTLIPYVPRGAQVLDYGAYAQDSWRVAPDLTINVGLRWDGETTRDVMGRTVWRFDNEWQPRIGVAWDPWGDGLTKIFAFAGRFSYALPTAAAGFAFGSLTRFTTFNFDPVNVVQDPTVLHHSRRSGVGGEFTSLVDAGLKDSYEDELTVGIERMLGPTLAVSLKGTYRSLGNAIEDRCDLDYTSPETDYNQCAFINPGSSGKFASGNVPTCNGLMDDPDWYQCSPTGPPSPAATRIYRGVELLARESIGTRLWLQASYVYSSLRGNFDGGVSQLWSQTQPGSTNDFDYPALWHDAYGALALERTNRFRFDGYWTTPLNLTVGLQTFVESGAPLNRLGFFNSSYGGAVFLVPRGSAGHLPTLWEANLTLAYPIAVGPATATLQAYVFNLFNNQIATSQDEAWTTSPPAAFPDTIYDPNQAQNNPDYGKVTSRYAPRFFRAAVKVSF